MKAFRAGLISLVLSATVLIAQSGPVTFDVVSIKANKTGSGHHEIGWSGARWTMTNVPAAGLILTAYPGRTDELMGAPVWVTAESFDIDARAVFDPTADQEQIMLRQLLKNRFKLVAHFETRERPVYNLVVARSDGRLRHVDIDCEAYRRGTIVLPPADPMPCSFRMSGGGAMTMVSGGRTMQSLADTLSGAAGRPVFDKTGLAGLYGFGLEYGGAGTDDLSVFTALQEQLGLKLESARGPVEVLVIDHIEHPTEN
jgi:uncharacterized protein (TIGR03435 family)